MGIRRPLLAALAAFVVAVVAVGVGLGGTTTSDPAGTLLLNGRKVFPIVLAKGPDAGSTTPAGGDALAEVAAAGATVLKVGPATVPWTAGDIADANTQDRAAAAHGLSTWVNLSTVSQATPGSSADTLLQSVVTSLQADSGAAAIAVWKGADEPFWSGIQPAALRFAYCRVTGRGDAGWCSGEPVLDGTRQWVTIEAPRGTAAQLAPYTAVTDIHGVDVYPVTLASASPDLHDVGRWTQTIASVTPSQAVWSTLQVCASGSYDTSGRYVLPTFAQERYMVYDAILNGARSIAFYGGNIPGCWSASDRQYGWNWTFWADVLKPLLAELNAASPLAPALVDPGSTRTLTTNDATTQAISRAGANGELWVIAARSGAGTAPVTVSGLPDGLASGTVYTEGRTVAVAGGSFTDDFAQWGVHVYRFVPATPSTTTTAATTTAVTTTTTPPTTTTTPTSTPPPPPSGGGGGGGGGVPNLAVAVSPASVSVAQGQAVDVSILVRNTGTAGSAKTHLLVDLPAGLELVGPPYYERGQGCTGTQHLDCDLDSLGNGNETPVRFEVRTPTPGTQAITATVTSDRDSDASDNSASATIAVTAPAPPPPAPRTPQVASHTYSGTAHGDRIVGTPFADLIYGRGGGDLLFGGRGNDVVYGGPGNDTLEGGRDLDRLFGGPGNDTLKARDGRRDLVDCGPGRDLALVDRLDRLSGCERVRRG